MENLLYTMFLGFFFGPGIASSYSLQFFSPEGTFLILSVLYVAPILLFFKLADSIHYRERREMKFFRRAADFAKLEVEKAVDLVDDIVVEFGKRRGELGYLIGLVIISFLFGVYLAIVLAYVFKIQEARAFFSISLGAMFGVIFWISVVFYSIQWISTDIFFGLGLLLAGVSMVYGRKREIGIIEESLRKSLRMSRDRFLSLKRKKRVP